MCNSSQLDLSDRIAIEAGLCAGKSFKEIARRIRCSPSTVSREVMRNREFIHGSFFLNNDCRYASRCKKKHICTNTYCDTLCVRCRSYDCRTGCSSYVPYRCGKLDYPPYVCNHCTYRHDCFKNRYLYSAKLAQAMSDNRRSDCRKGTRIDLKELEILDAIVAAGIKKGQPLTHIYENHKHELSVSVRTIYNYVDEGILSVRNIDLRRKVRYKKRSKTIDTQEKDVPFYRLGRTYADYERFMLDNPNCPVVQMDTVKGRKEKGAVILTMLLLKYDVMLLFRMPDCKASSVIDVFDFLTSVLDLEVFHRLFPVILTDNGSEFKKVEELEYACTGEQRCMLFYCDPMASWQKGELEKDHEYIRYVIPKGSDLNTYSDDDIHLLMNHINSVKRTGLHGKCPYENVPPGDEDMAWLMQIMGMDTIPPDDVHLKPDLFK